MQYSDKVKQHVANPRNVGTLDESDPNVGTGAYGSPACGDVMKLQILVDQQQRITDAKFKTFGCGSAIASSSLLTEKVIGKTIKQAQNITNQQIAAELELPPIKVHCSVMAEEALKAALDNYHQKQNNKP